MDAPAVVRAVLDAGAGEGCGGRADLGRWEGGEARGMPGEEVSLLMSRASDGLNVLLQAVGQSSRDPS